MNSRFSQKAWHVITFRICFMCAVIMARAHIEHFTIIIFWIFTINFMFTNDMMKYLGAKNKCPKNKCPFFFCLHFWRQIYLSRDTKNEFLQWFTFTLATNVCKKYMSVFFSAYKNDLKKRTFIFCIDALWITSTSEWFENLRVKINFHPFTLLLFVHLYKSSVLFDTQSQ